MKQDITSVFRMIVDLRNYLLFHRGWPVLSYPWFAEREIKTEELQWLDIFILSQSPYVSGFTACMLDTHEFWGPNPFGVYDLHLLANIMQCAHTQTQKLFKLLLLTDFDWVFILLLFFSPPCSLAIATRANKALLLPTPRGAQRSAHISPNFSTWELFPVSCNFDLFSFQCHLHSESKIQSRENIRDVLHHRTTLSALCFGTEKAGKTITCLSELFGWGKQESLCSHLCNPGSNQEGYRKVKTDPWFKGKRMAG